MLSDGDLIRNLLGQYCERLDAGDFEGVGGLFAHGRLAADSGHVLATGASEVTAFYERGTRRHEGSPRTKHLVVDTVLDPADADHVVARSSYVVLQAVAGALALQPIIAGRYVDRFERAGDGWRWTERQFSVDLLGDLAHHLVYEL
ncbi:MAG: nuclear transport factor 2 family protein [Acidimicrobiales bacterium]|nr:nuclear transport factor 2 family protein [Acidimicrobiales bacterium]